MIILGIDPGSRHTGYGVIVREGNTERLVEYGTLHLDVARSHVWRLQHIYARVTEVIERVLPDVCAIEMPVYARNPQSMLKLGRAQASAMLAALNRDIPVTEYTPKEIKKAVTGRGNATKEQVWYMVRSILAIREAEPEGGLDAADALAIAICHAHRHEHGAPKRYQDWGSFVRANPDRSSG